MIHRLPIAILAAGLVACSSPGVVPSTCGISTRVTLSSSTLAAEHSLRIQRAGEGFLLMNTLSVGAHTPWVRAAKDGELGPIIEPAAEGTMLSYLGLAAVGQHGPADQIVAVKRAHDPEVWGYVAAAVVDEQTGLLGPSHAVLNAEYYGQTIQLAMESSLDGRRAIYAHGNRTLEDPQVIVLGADAERHGDPIVVKTGPDHLWDCLSVIPTAAAAAISVVEKRDESRFWHLVELDAEGARVFEASVDITDELGCPTTTVTKHGFAALLRGSDTPPIVVDIDRATFADDGETRVSLGEEEPATRAWSFAAMNGGYAAHFSGGAEGAKAIRFFDSSGEALIGGLDLPAGVGIEHRIQSSPGSLLLSFREDDGRWGWLEATCGDTSP